MLLVCMKRMQKTDEDNGIGPQIIEEEGEGEEEDLSDVCIF